MKKKLMIHFSALFLLFIPIFTVSTAQAEAKEGSVDLVGVIGPQYEIRAENFHIAAEKVPAMDILTLSKAAVHNLQSDTLDTKGIKVISSSVQAVAGVYDVTLGLEQDPSVEKNIKVFVYDDNTLVVGSTIVFSARDFSVRFSEKRTLTDEKTKKLAQVEAYDIPTGTELTSDIKTDKEDLKNYIETKDLSDRNMKFHLTVADKKQENIPQKISKQVKAKTINDAQNQQLPNTSSASSTPNKETNGKRTLPQTGEKKTILSSVSGFLLIFFVICYFYWRKRKKE